MGYNDHIEDMRPDLPSDAGEDTRFGYQPDNEWLQQADHELCREAMRMWFLTRYWDPANETPYISSEGGYIFIHGGPYDATEELTERFEELVSGELIQEVVNDVESDGIFDWAPIHTEPDYDSDFEFEIGEREKPYRSFIQKLEGVDALADSNIDAERKPLLRQLLFSSLIAALEAYVAETMSYWLFSDRQVLRRFVESCEEFSKEKIRLADVFARIDRIENDVDEYIKKQVWHRLDKVGKHLSISLAIKMPPIEDLMKHIVIRHDIVHRGGKTKEGDIVSVSDDKLAELKHDTVEFVEHIEKSLAEQFDEF